MQCLTQGKARWRGSFRTKVASAASRPHGGMATGGRWWLGAAAAALVVGLLPGQARAEVVDEKEVGRLTLGFLIGYAGNSMSRFNENIGVVNHFLEAPGIRHADKLGGGASAQGELRYKLNPHFSVGFGAANLESKSTFSVTLAEMNFYARSTALSPMLYYHMPFVQSSEAFVNVADRLSFYAGAGPVFLTKGQALTRIIDRTNEPQFTDDGDLGELDGEGQASGTGLGFRGLVGGSYQLTSRFSVAGEVGYRRGKITDLKLDYVRGFERIVAGNDPDRREPLEKAIKDFFERKARAAGLPERDINQVHIPYYNDFDGPLDLDFSGITLQIGFRLHL